MNRPMVRLWRTSLPLWKPSTTFMLILSSGVSNVFMVNSLYAFFMSV